LCAACRAHLQATAKAAAPQAARPQKPLCFGCYRAELERRRELRAAGELNTASESRFQCTLPFEPVNRARLARLRAARAEARAAGRQGAELYADRRRRAQIAARHALQSVAEGLRTRGMALPERHTQMAAAIHAAELQLPDAWLPFVISQ
jgi:hypothetical protein